MRERGYSFWVIVAALLGAPLFGCASSHVRPADDRDGDGYTSDVDCDDDDETVHPGASEYCAFSCEPPYGDGRDNDCDGVVDEECGPVTNCFWDAGPLPVDAGPPPDPDLDLDGYTQSLDCNDGDASVHPGAVEWCGDGIDQDCDGLVDESDCVFVGNGMLDAPALLESASKESDAPA